MRSGTAESDSNPGSKYCYLRRVRLPFHSHPQMLSHSSFPDHDCFHSGHAQAGLLRPAAEISITRRIRIKPGRLCALKTKSFHNVFQAYGGLFCLQAWKTASNIAKHNFKDNAVVFRVTLQRIMLKFSSIMFPTQYLFHWLSRRSKESWVKICYPKEAHNAIGHNTNRPVQRPTVRSSVL